MGQNLRFALLFLLSLNRLIVEKYGGKTGREDFLRRENFTLLRNSMDFCYDYKRDWGWDPHEGFGWERPNFWYIVNLLVCLFLFFFAIRSNFYKQSVSNLLLFRNMVDICRKCHCKNGMANLKSVFDDILLLLLGFFTILVGSRAHSLVLTIMALWMTLQELQQMRIHKSKYFTVGNCTDVATLLLTAFLLFVPTRFELGLLT